ncbi:MAG TPA: energy transducer TonB [Thermoanaerobaculia bacterium]|nr:energy transducer TonB [Thermoanaerobaculia bacterium]
MDLLTEPGRKEGRISVATVVSIAIHVLLLILFIRAHRTPLEMKHDAAAIRFVELIRGAPREFVEAPGPAMPSAPLDAPLSDANRRASTPEPTGNQPTKRPGDGSGLYTPPMGSASAPAESLAPAAGTEPAAASAEPAGEASSRIPPLHTEASTLPGEVNWRSAIQEVGKMASIAGNQGIDLSGVAGGERGFAEAGPLSFETQWYNWGDYAQSMVSRIRVNWYNIMPQLIRTGLQGVVTIRFTIHRDGRITDVTLLESSTIPPYDFAARKAIEASSPLNPLPPDFPKPTERVTAMFYYNRQPPAR